MATRTPVEQGADPPPPVRYRLQWGFTILLVVGLALNGYRLERAERGLGVEVAGSAIAEVDWFQVVLLPELPPDAVEATRYADLLASWMDALRGEGMHVLPLGMLLERLERRQGVPAPAVALHFEPGYRVTYDAVRPVIHAGRMPVTWITQDTGRNITDRRFLPSRLRSRMARSGFWEIGLRDPAQDTIHLHVLHSEPSRRRTFAWAPATGRQGINRTAGPTLNRLHANLAWSPESFIDRVLAEHPVREATPLTARTIQGRLWGTVPRRQDARPSGFDLITSPERHLAGASWLGTAGLADLTVDLTVRQRYGQLWLRLRSDGGADRCLNVGFTGDELRVDVRDAGITSRRAAAPWSLTPGGPLSASVQLRGSRLEVRAGGRQMLVVDDLDIPPSPTAMFELAVSDILPGAAQALGIELHLTPGAPEPVPAAAEGVDT